MDRNQEEMDREGLEGNFTMTEFIKIIMGSEFATKYIGFSIAEKILCWTCIVYLAVYVTVKLV